MVAHLLLGLLATMPVVAGNPAEDSPMITELSALRTSGVFPIQVATAPHTSDHGDVPCAWFEWAAGRLASGTDEPHAPWVTYRSGARTDAPIGFTTPLGVLTLDPSKVRFHLMPHFERHWPAQPAPDDPPSVTAWRRSEPGPVTVREYCLAPGRTYYAEVITEVYHLPPPGPDAEPVEGKNTVLRVSDRLWTGSMPDVPATPSTQEHTY